jgi:hypothetical protein
MNAVLFSKMNRIMAPLKTNKFKADETEKAELHKGNEHFEVEVKRRNSKFLKVPISYITPKVPVHFHLKKSPRILPRRLRYVSKQSFSVAVSLCS